jgi:ABC-type sugar transport system ATPase subunit
LQDASLSVEAGEVVGLVGDNGAGKSTLVNVVGGVQQPDSGVVRLRGAEVRFRSVAEARSDGIEVVHQDLGLCQQLPIYQNVFLGRELTNGLFLRRRVMRRRAKALLEEYGIRIANVDDPAADLSGGQRQLVALVRIVLREVLLAILDEPTAALSARAAEQVYEMVRGLADHGVAVLLISHNLEDVLRVCDAVVVMRHGHTVARVRPQEVSSEDLLGLMTGALALDSTGRIKATSVVTGRL